MTGLPTGIVTFLMTDIEGSTRLVRDVGPAFPALLDDHFRLLGAAISAHGGTIVSTEGDSVFAVFPSAREAVLAAADGQRALGGHAWPAGATVRVRMGVHAGEAILGGRDYTGLEVHRTARIMAAGHGGQVLVSAAAAALAGDVAREGLTFKDLGAHQLRDMPASESLVQLAGEGLAADFPALRTSAATTPTNLPAPATRFVGRAGDLAAIRAALGETRLLTLTGPGGTGKTRLAIETARASMAAYPDGVWFIALDVIRDPALVFPAVAGVLGLREDPSKTPVALVAEHLAGRRALLVLDNLEQVIAIAPDVAVFLAATTAPTVLGTSREPLSIGGERLFAVPPLAVPDEPGSPTAASLAGNDCVALFVERARAAKADFALTDSNAAAVAAICRRLDGLPLALELAAARVNVLSPEQILGRMDHRLTLLASSRRDLTERQRTLRGAIEWSYDLLTEPERVFFRRFSVFAGGAGFETAQTVIDPAFEVGDVLDLAAALVDRSLLRSVETPDGNRLVMLETIREYAGDVLQSDPAEFAAVSGRHAAAYLALVERHRNVLTDPTRDVVLERLDRELPNIRTAVNTTLTQADLASALSIVTAAMEFLLARDHHAEGRSMMDRILATPRVDAYGPLTVEAILSDSQLANWQTDYEAGRQLAARGLALAETLGEPELIAYAHSAMGWATEATDPAGASSEFRQAVEIGRSVSNPQQLTGTLQGLGLTLMALGDYPSAEQAIDESIALTEQTGDTFTMLFGLTMRGALRSHLGNPAGAWRDHQVALETAKGFGSVQGIALSVEVIALDAALAGDHATAATLGAGALRVRDAGGGGPSVASAGFPLPGEIAAEHLPAAEAAALADEGRSLPTDELIRRAGAWLDAQRAAGPAGEAAPALPDGEAAR
jgi:predicted ATPase/class 3 adenylate cyclase